MSDTLGRVVQLIQEGRVLVSIHGYDEMAEDGILAVEAIEGAAVATVIEDYPDTARALVRWCCNETGAGARSMWCGASRGDRCRQPCWLRPTGLIPLGGPTTFCGGDDEQTTPHQTRTRGDVCRRG
jgi:hypothetical protein